jgi:hypothetical protein
MGYSLAAGTPLAPGRMASTTGNAHRPLLDLGLSNSEVPCSGLRFPMATEVSIEAIEGNPSAGHRTTGQIQLFSMLIG